MSRIGAALLGLAIVVSACEPGPPERTAVTPTAQTSRGARPRCGVIDIASSDYGWSLHPRVAEPGDRVTLTGTTLRSEGGRWTPARRFEFWFNTKVPDTQVLSASPLAPGPIVLLATVRDLRRCTFEATFTVPDAPPGRYRIAGSAYDREGYGSLLSHVLTVTEPSP